jgi:hypothetical protein
MPSKWSGDGRYHLPAQQVEPYRLWFEFLKASFQDSTVRVNEKHYQSWGDVRGQTFNQWWGGETWRRLFAIDNSVRILECSEELPRSDPSIVVRLPLGRETKDVLAEVEALLVEHEASSKVSKVRHGRFALSEGFEKGFLKRMNAIRCYLRMYQYWVSLSHLDKDRRLDTVALKYHDWALDWAEKIRLNKWNRPPPYFPNCFRAYTAYLRRDAKQFNQEEIGTFNKSGDGTDAANARRMIARNLRKARKIATNVSEGVFPGKYE